MTRTEITTRIAEMVTDLWTLEHSVVALREQAELLIKEIMEGEEETP